MTTTVIETIGPVHLTNGQRAAFNARSCGIGALAPVLTELYNMIDAQARRISELELAETQRQARRKDKPLVAATT